MVDRLTLNFVQIANATTVATTYPAVTNSGLPFGDFAPLAAPVPVSGDIIGFPNLGSLTLVYFFYDEAKAEWWGGTTMAMSIDPRTGTYTGSITWTAQLYTALLMRTSYWNQFIAGITGPVFKIVTSLPSPLHDPGDVLWSQVCTPGLGRSIAWRTGIGLSSLTQMAPGEVLPTDMAMPFAAAIGTTQADPTNFRLNGVTISPTDPRFISSLLAGVGTPYAPPPIRFDKNTPPPALPCFVLSGVSPDLKANGVFCLWVFIQKLGQVSNYYLLGAAAGPRTGHQPITMGALLARESSLKHLDLELNAILTVFADRLSFNIVGRYEQETMSALGAFMKVYTTLMKKVVGIMFSA
jgi:hypothetical protein